MIGNAKWIATIATTMVIAACGGGGDGSNNVVYNQTNTISENQQLSVILPAGTYRADITSSNNGVITSWVGGNSCATSAETKAYSASCNLVIQGQLLVLNPTLLGLGGDEIVTVLVTRL